MTMSAHGWTRREVLRELGWMAGGLLAAPMAAACAGRPPERMTVAPAAGAPRLTPGVHPLGLGGERDGVIYVPDGLGADAGLILMLHGAGGSGRRAVRLMAGAAETAGCVVIAPDSRGRTWDAVLGGFGPDVRFIERALVRVMPPDGTGPVAVAGFSDGATYALGLGRANGHLFTHTLAFSPGFLLPTHPAGSPRIFVSHGRSDQVLPIDSCSRVLVPELRREGYDVRYREFDGRHEVPPAVVREAVEWLAAPATRRDPPVQQ